MRILTVLALGSALFLSTELAWGAEPAEVLDLWQGEPPGYQVESGPERDTSGPDGRHVAGRPVIRLGHVSTPQLHIYRPQEANGTSVVVCPGGGFNILAWDLEGTEVAEWLNSLGVTAAVLKYRVPTAQADKKWLAPVQDAQRALSTLRSLAEKYQLDRQRVGILGFSAGGHTAARAALATERHYEAGDAIDAQPAGANFAILVYPAWLVDDDGRLLAELKVAESSPPIFFAHARDDRISSQSSIQLFSALQEAGVPGELHVYSGGGHGFGLRASEAPATRWPHSAAAWMRYEGLIEQ